MNCLILPKSWLGVLEKNCCYVKKWIVRLLECVQQQERKVFSENVLIVYDIFHNVLL